jgi:hypothetical protein
MSRPMIIYTSARVGDIGPWPKRKALTPFDQKMASCYQEVFILGGLGQR